jgi:hypothetical protein
MLLKPVLTVLIWRTQWVKDAELKYRVIAINKSGEGSPSNTVMAVL